MYSDAEMLERIVRRLEALGLSERQACLDAGVGVDTIRDIRRGRSPRVEVAVKLAAILKCRVEWLLTGKGSETDEGAALTPRQRALLGQLDRLPPEEQDRLLKLARALEQQDDGASVELRRG